MLYADTILLNKTDLVSASELQQAGVGRVASIIYRTQAHARAYSRITNYTLDWIGHPCSLSQVRDEVVALNPHATLTETVHAELPVNQVSA